MSKIIRNDADGNEIVQGSDAWKALRIGMLTGTGIANILPGKATKEFPLGKYKEARQQELDEIVTEIITGKPSGGFIATKFVKEGIEREPIARMYMEEVFGYVIEEVAFVKHDWLRVGISPDGLVVGQKRNVEIKSPKDRTHLRYWLEKSTPPEYVPQVQSQMWITGAEVTDFASYHPDFPEDMQLHVVHVERDEKYINMIEEEVSKFLSEVNIKVSEVQEIRNNRKATQ